jgi:hypothetical protein
MMHKLGKIYQSKQIDMNHCEQFICQKHSHNYANENAIYSYMYKKCSAQNHHVAGLLS